LTGSRLPVGGPRPTRAPKSKDPSSRIGEALEEIAALEAELEFLESELPPLQARLDAAVRPLISEIVALRQELVGIVERAAESAPRRGTFGRDAEDLVAHLVSDLEERFGVRVSRHIGGRSLEFREDEDESSDEDFTWAEPERHSPREDSIARHRARRAPVDPQSTAKGIYHALARELHPDKTRDETERVRRTELMQNLTRTWKDRDLGALLRLLHAHGSDEAKSGAMDDASLKACAAGLDAELDALRRKVRNLRHQGLPGGVVDWMPVLRDPKLFERLLRRQKAIPREEAEQLRHWRNLWRVAGGLERFFREVPDHLWKEVV
jgi:hypothetical protein